MIICQLAAAAAAVVVSVIAAAAANKDYKDYDPQAVVSSASVSEHTSHLL